MMKTVFDFFIVVFGFTFLIANIMFRITNDVFYLNYMQIVYFVEVSLFTLTFLVMYHLLKQNHHYEFNRTKHATITYFVCVSLYSYITIIFIFLVKRYDFNFLQTKCSKDMWDKCQTNQHGLELVLKITYIIRDEL